MPRLDWKINNGQAVLTLQKKMAAGLEGINRESKDLAQTNRQLDTLARRVWRNNATGVEKYRAEVAKLDAALAKKKITDEHHRLESERLAAQYLSTGEKGAKAQMKIRRAARDARAEFKAGIITAEEYNRKIRELNQQYVQAGASGNSAFGSKARQMFAGYVSGAGAAAAAIGLIRSEIEQAGAAAERIAESQVSQAEARRSLKLSVVGRTDIDPTTKKEVRRLVEDEADRISIDVGVDKTKVDKVVEVAISASATPQRGIAFAEKGLEFTNGIEGTEHFVAGMLDTANALGLRGRDRNEMQKNAMTAMGFLNEVRQASRVTSTDKVAQNLPRVLQAFKSQGVDPRMSAALFSGLTIAGADPHGDVSRTAAMNLLPKMDKFFRENKFKGLRPEDHDTATEQLALLMNDPRLSGNFIKSPQGKEFVNSVTASQAFLDRVAKNSDFRAAGRAGIIGFFDDPNSEARQAFHINRSRLRDFNQLRTNAEEGISFLREGSNDAAFRKHQAAKAAMQQHESKREDLASSEMIDNVKTLLIDSNIARSRAYLGLRLFMNAGPEVTNQELSDFIGQQAGGRIRYARENTDESILQMRLDPDRNSIGTPMTLSPVNRSALNSLDTLQQRLSDSTKELNEAASNLKEASRPDSIPSTGPQE